MNMKVSEADAFLWPKFSLLRLAYHKTPSVDATYREGLKILLFARSLSGFRSSYQIAGLESFLAEIRLASGSNVATVQAAKAHSESALNILQAIRNPTAEILRLTVHTALINVVSIKAMGNLDKAFNASELAKWHASQVLSATDVDLIPLVRQEALMRQSGEFFTRLAQSAYLYRAERPAEYYATVKRFFEYLLNAGKITPARQVKKSFEQAYLSAQKQLPLLSKVSFIKNMGHFFLLDKQRQLGQGLLDEALKAANRFGLDGQRRQIARLLQESQLGNAHLPAFRVV